MAASDFMSQDGYASAGCDAPPAQGERSTARSTARPSGRSPGRNRMLI